MAGRKRKNNDFMDFGAACEQREKRLKGGNKKEGANGGAPADIMVQRLSLYYILSVRIHSCLDKRV